jgi:hypothetical protein
MKKEAESLSQHQDRLESHGISRTRRAREVEGRSITYSCGGAISQESQRLSRTALGSSQAVVHPFLRKKLHHSNIFAPLAA